jgi:hypothetical protein
MPAIFGNSGGLLKDRITLAKKDGTLFEENVPASVRAKMIIINDINLPIERDDHILRKLPRTGLVSVFFPIMHCL